MIQHKIAVKVPQKSPEPPAKLRKPGRAFWQAATEEFELSARDLILLEKACVHLDRADAARRDIRRRGLLVEDRFKIMVENPAVAIERAADNAFRLLVRELALDTTAVDSRPASLPRGYRA